MIYNKGKSNPNFGKFGKASFGYKDGRTLKKYYCKDCNKKIGITSGVYGKGRCSKCSHKGNKHYLFGKHLSKKQKKKISLHHANVKGINNGNYKHGKHCNNNKCIDCGKEIDYRSKRCYLCQGKNNRGKNHYFYGKIAQHGLWGQYKDIKMRSSYEVKFAQFLDLSGIKYKYEPKAFDLGNTTYTPDFYIPEWDLWIEIKCWWRDDAEYKFRKFKRLYKDINIKIFNNKKLKYIGII